jgi:hypothetical protein
VISGNRRLVIDEPDQARPNWHYEEEAVATTKKTVPSTGEKEPKAAVPNAATGPDGPTSAEEKAALEEKARLQELAEQKKDVANARRDEAAAQAAKDEKEVAKANA